MSFQDLIIELNDKVWTRLNRVVELLHEEAGSLVENLKLAESEEVLHNRKWCVVFFYVRLFVPCFS